VSARGNPNKIVYAEPVDELYLAFAGKQLEFQAGGRIGTLVVQSGSLTLSGLLEVGQVVMVDPRNADGSPDHGVYLQAASGVIGTVVTLGTKRDHGKMGNGTHDLAIGTWVGRCWPPDPVPAGDEPPHRDGIQIMHAHRVQIGWFDFRNVYPGATNGGIWINPNKADPEAVDEDDPTLCTDIVVDGGRILNPNAAIHLGACTRCGARNTLLVAQRPFRLKDTTVDPIGITPSGAQADGNTFVVLEW
jgi:hypothetical protein